MVITDNGSEWRLLGSAFDFIISDMGSTQNLQRYIDQGHWYAD